MSFSTTKFLRMLYCRILGGRIAKNSLSAMSKRGISPNLGSGRLIFGDVANRLRRMALDTCGSILVVLIRPTWLSLAGLLTPCFDGIGKLLFAMPICRMCPATAVPGSLDPSSSQVGGSREDGPCKSSWRLRIYGSIIQNGTAWEPKERCAPSSRRLPVYVVNFC